jgi:uncharacterized protein (DUF433 family)/predicted HTH domain antitoxin
MDEAKVWRNPEIVLGKPVIRGTRLSVAFLLRGLASMGIEELLRQYPFLTKEDVAAALEYAADILEGKGEGRGTVASGAISVKEVVLRLPKEICLLIGSAENLERELLKRVVVALYAEKKISLGKAAELCGLCYVDFMDLLADFGLYLNYDVEDLEEDLRTLEALKRDHKDK